MTLKKKSVKVDSCQRNDSVDQKITSPNIFDLRLVGQGLGPQDIECFKVLKCVECSFSNRRRSSVDPVLSGQLGLVDSVRGEYWRRDWDLRDSRGGSMSSVDVRNEFF